MTELVTQSDYHVKLEMFEGPFELLLYLIEKDQMDIFDIPIADITRQFIEHLDLMHDRNIEVTSNFLVMASTLLALKAKLLLPAITQDEDELTDIENTKQMLVDNILYYKTFKEIAGDLDNLKEQALLYRSRPVAEELFMQFFAKQNPLEGKDLSDLLAAYQNVLQKIEQQEVVFEIPPRQVTIESKITTINIEAQKHENGFLFSKLFADCCSKNEMVITFLALLELIRKGCLKVVQNTVYEDIYICQCEVL